MSCLKADSLSAVQHFLLGRMFLETSPCWPHRIGCHRLWNSLTVLYFHNCIWKRLLEAEVECHVPEPICSVSHEHGMVRCLQAVLSILLTETKVVAADRQLLAVRIKSQQPSRAVCCFGLQTQTQSLGYKLLCFVQQATAVLSEWLSQPRVGVFCWSSVPAVAAVTADPWRELLALTQLFHSCWPSVCYVTHWWWAVISSLVWRVPCVLLLSLWRDTGDPFSC